MPFPISRTRRRRPGSCLFEIPVFFVVSMICVAFVTGVVWLAGRPFGYTVAGAYWTGIITWPFWLLGPGMVLVSVIPNKEFSFEARVASAVVGTGLLMVGAAWLSYWGEAHPTIHWVARTGLFPGMGAVYAAARCLEENDQTDDETPRPATSEGELAALAVFAAGALSIFVAWECFDAGALFAGRCISAVGLCLGLGAYAQLVECRDRRGKGEAYAAPPASTPPDPVADARPAAPANPRPS